MNNENVGQSVRHSRHVMIIMMMAEGASGARPRRTMRQNLHAAARQRALTVLIVAVGDGDVPFEKELGACTVCRLVLCHY